MDQWVRRWGYEVSKEIVREGIYRLRSGGYLIRGRVTDRATGKRQTVIKALPDVSLPEASRYRAAAMLGAREEKARQTPPFGSYAVALLDRKVLAGDLRSKKSEERWEDTLQHLIKAFGNKYLDELRYADIEKWKDTLALRMNADPDLTRKYIDSRGKERTGKVRISPRTANGWLSILRVIMKQATAEFELERDPAAAVRDFDTSTVPTYTDEEPNALLVDVVPKFLGEMQRTLPQHYAMTFLGFVTGLRPSSLRPLRRDVDVLWDENVILVRRSNAIGDVVMEKTKTAKRQRISLPKEVMQVLRDHLDALDEAVRKDPDSQEAKRMAESVFLFPSETGGMRSRSTLDKPFAKVKDALKLAFQFTPRGMRRTYQDLARAAEVKDIVTRAVSGHSTETMQELYSTVGAGEMRAGLAKVYELATARAEKKARQA